MFLLDEGSYNINSCLGHSRSFSILRIKKIIHLGNYNTELSKESLL